MPVRLPGVAQVIKQVGPKKWAPNQIQVLQEAERIRKRQEDGRPVDPRDIMAWAQLAQFVLKDETLIGGLVNMMSRGARKGAIKEREERAITERQALEDRQGAFMAEYPVGAVVPGEPLPGAAPPAEGAPVLAPGPLPTEALPEPPTPQAEAATRALAVQPGKPITRQSMYEDILREEGEAREAEVAEYKRIARERQLTVSDLYGLAATAKSPEAVRTLMAMVPTVVEQDPAFAPRSLSELLFGGSKRGEGIGKELIGIWGQTQKFRRGDTIDRRLERRSKTEERYRLLGVKQEGMAAQAEQRRAAAGLSGARAEDIGATQSSRIARTEAQTKKALAQARKADAQANRLQKRYLSGMRSKYKVIARHLTAEEQLILADYALWADAKDKKSLRSDNQFKGLGAASARALAGKLVVNRHVGKKTHSNVRMTVDAIASKEFKGGKPDKAEITDMKKLTYWVGQLKIADKAWSALSMYEREEDAKKATEGKESIKARKDKAEDHVKTLEKRLGMEPGSSLVKPSTGGGGEGVEGGEGATDAEQMGWGPG
jgi:hypothetical protein